MREKPSPPRFVSDWFTTAGIIQGQMEHIYNQGRELVPVCSEPCALSLVSGCSTVCKCLQGLLGLMSVLSFPFMAVAAVLNFSQAL